ncbi:MalY/PatB family protein [Wenxinia marina]|uniref:cysteine-S-conjugate beta-lyase n=1 Tax=Wenxinia marina DSM 24838 TaxID=1123501 RepID=A0A0D0NGS0_9RHOB|nr:aminotransferase class I/II-fold pyridoxal phosphate-dependent enzyme [Wenxinia marina]KIQ67525.1 Bifunctional PLP-dependent enzyme [Wenxinia marina DSM 24838]GGL68811.1 aminotransferase [Wenxinia marina]
MTHTFDFDTPAKRRGCGSAKWDALSAILGDDAPDDALPMWVAQTDFAPAPCIQAAARRLADAGQWGYFTGLATLFERAAWWQETRHGWAADPGRYYATHGLGNAIGLTLQALTEPGDGIVVLSPVYHEFAGKIGRNGRTLVEAPLSIGPDGRFALDLEALEASLTGRERMLLISAPHNPAGRIWSAEEMRGMHALCRRHGMVLVSDEIHQDLAFPGHAHVPAAAAIDDTEGLVVMSAASKTFDVAGLRTGLVWIADDDLRDKFGRLHRALDIQPNIAGHAVTCAAYSPEGAAWVDALMAYLDGNRQTFCDGVNAIPGLSAMPMDATFLAWVDFSGTGMEQAEIDRRVMGDARIAPTPGPSLGHGGGLHHRFNIGTQRDVVAAAVDRLRDAFADLQ